MIECRMHLLSVPAPYLSVSSAWLRNVGLAFVARPLLLLVGRCTAVSSACARQALSRGQKRAMPRRQIIDGI